MHLRVICIACERDLIDLRDHLYMVAKHTITIDGLSSTTEDVLHLARAYHADIVVLDPSLDAGNLLSTWRSEVGATPVLVCYSADDTYALDAIRAGAVYYITPENRGELDEALDRAAARIIRYDREGGNGNAARETRAPFQCRVIALPGTDGIEVRASDHLLSAHGEGGYTRILLEDESPMLLSRSLGEVEPALRDAGLLRVHRSHMINPERVRRVRRGKTSIVEMVNGVEVDVSERYRDVLFDMLQIRIGRKQDQA